MDTKLNILHIDMDAFYASVEEADNPSLKGTPVIVGGKNKHSIVTTCNYEARKFGVHSAMPIFMAKKLCPHANFVPNRKGRYDEVSKKVFEIFYTITNQVEKVSIDEAYMDIKNIDEKPLDLARRIQNEVFEKTDLTLSIGISYNKFLAKLASDWKKPKGITIIDHKMIPDILLPLPIKKVHGIGPKTEKRLNSIGIYTIEDLYALSEDFLTEMFGKKGPEIFQRIRGIDNRIVDTNRERKSLGTERTFMEASNELSVLSDYLKSFSKEISGSMKEKNIYGRTVTLKAKYSDFKVITRSLTLNDDINDESTIYNTALILLTEINLDKKLRLIGLSLSNLSEEGAEQLSIFRENKN